MDKKTAVICSRFWSKVLVSHNLRCWPWRGAKTEDGYGQFRMAGRTIRSPRVAFWLYNQSWPRNACHKCDNPICCNPGHIYDGSHADNMRDLSQRGSHKNVPRGENHYATALSAAAVTSMREEYKAGDISIHKIAKVYGVSFSAAQRILTNKTWKHIL